MFFKRILFFFRTLYHLSKAFFQMLYGAWHISKLEGPIITIYGGTSFKLTNQYALEAEKLAHMLAKAGVSILTGAGGGIMEAAGKGAEIKRDHETIKSIGIGVAELDEIRSPYVGEYFELKYFFARKWLMTRFSVGFVYFPGGIGTLDELFEILTLKKTKKMQLVPVILVGKEFWQPLLDWMLGQLLYHEAITKQDLELFELTDDLDRVFSLVCATCKVDGNNK